MPPVDPPAPVGHVVLHVSADRQIVPKVPVVPKKLVVVAFVPVAFEKVKFCKVEEPLARMFPKVPNPELLNIVLKSVVENRFVVVAFVPVALTKVKF